MTESYQSKELLYRNSTIYKQTLMEICTKAFSTKKMRKMVLAFRLKTNTLMYMKDSGKMEKEMVSASNI